MIATLKSLLLLNILLFAPLALSAQGRMRVSCQQQFSRTADAEAYLAESVDEMPRFPGGEAALIKFINSVRQYPTEAYANRVQGRVLCSFIVGSDGAISNIEVVRGVDESLNREAVRIIRHMPRWEAGKLDGTTVPVFCLLPIPFRL